MHFAERRQAPRYAVEWPVELGVANGRTRDVSTSGVFFELDEPFVPGAPIRVSLALGGGSCLRCEGRIVRVERREGKLGIAVAVAAQRFDYE